MAAAEPSGAVATGGEQRACFVVLLALGIIGENVVSLGYGLELLLGSLVTWILVRVQFASELAVLLLDLITGGVLGHTEKSVEVLLKPILVHVSSFMLSFLRADTQSVPATATRAARNTRDA